jgi:hypothetical protein
MSAERVELVEQQERFVRALLGRIESGASLEAQATLVKAGVQAGRSLLELRELGYAVSDDTVAFVFDQLDAGVARMIELMPREFDQLDAGVALMIELMPREGWS